MWTAELAGLVFSIGFVAGVIGNLCATLIVGLPAMMHLHAKLNRHHRELTESKES